MLRAMLSEVEAQTTNKMRSVSKDEKRDNVLSVLILLVFLGANSASAEDFWGKIISNSLKVSMTIHPLKVGRLG